MLEEIPAQQFTEWLAYYQLEPWGILADDVLSAQWKAIYVNSLRKRGKQARKIKEFLMFGEKEKNAADIFEQEEDDGYFPGIPEEGA